MNMLGNSSFLDKKRMFHLFQPTWLVRCASLHLDQLPSACTPALGTLHLLKHDLHDSAWPALYQEAASEAAAPIFIFIFIFCIRGSCQGLHSCREGTAAVGSFAAASNAACWTRAGQKQPWT